MENKINVQELFAIIGEQSLTIRMMQQRIATLEAALKDQDNEKSDIP